MGLMNALSQWRNNREEKRINQAESLGICPECRGRGFYTFADEYYYTNVYDCVSCNGSGLFEEWDGRG